MSSDVASTVQLLLLNNDITFATATVMVYDYILMFPSEVKYIWSKPWTWVTVLYLIVRYGGFYYAMKTSFYGSTFLPGPINNEFRCTDFGYAGDWAFAAFDCAASLLMVLRVYALWNRSKIIFVILLLCYTIQAVEELVWVSLFENPYVDATIGTAQVLNYSICTEVYPVIGPYEKYTLITPMLFDVLILVLALIPLVKQSMAMYKATRCWEPNRYMSLIVREGVAYFILTLLNNIPQALINWDNPLAPVWSLILGFLYIITMFPIFPRFVISMRELFDKDSHGRLGGIDSAFAIHSHARNVTGQDTTVSGIAFVAGSHPDEEGGPGGEEIQLEVAIGDDDTVLPI